MLYDVVWVVFSGALFQVAKRVTAGNLVKTVAFSTRLLKIKQDSLIELNSR